MLREPVSVEKPALTLCGTYTLDPVGDVVDYWSDFLGLGLGVRIAPYAQLFQQLLDPLGELRRNPSGANAVLLRWTDLLARPAGALAGHAAASQSSTAQSSTGHEISGDVEARVAEVAAALASFAHIVPCLVIVGPSDQRDPLLDRATAQLQSLLTGTPNLSVETGARAMQRYGVEAVHDPAADRFGHVPFTAAAIAALGTTIARWYAALARSPMKLVAVDADHTLWAGVVAEDGVDGVRVDGAHAHLQTALVEQHDAGRLLCLLSKNEEADVRGVFDGHPDMPLRWSHLVAHRVDWNPKPHSLDAIVAGLGLGLDSVVFLDDNPIECAEMRARCPAVATVRVPTDPAQLAAFADHLWLFDRPTVTDEDRGRTRMYRENASRAELRRGTGSLQGFLDGLELVVEIAPPSTADVPRLAQLSQRTNQFNASLVRCDEHELRRAAGDADGFLRLVRARDRFGDYGVVGQLRGGRQAGELAIDLFMLSCRALGRGIEYRMLAAAGEHALSLGLADVAVLFRGGDRNAPARRFLERAFGSSASPGDHWFRLPARRVAEVVFDASLSDGADDRGPDARGTPQKDDLKDDLRADARPMDARHADIGARYELIAHTLTTGARIGQAIAGRSRPRPDLASGFIAPAAGLERAIAAIWQQVLRIEPVGSHDRFQDLGGKSIHLVQVHSLLIERLNVALDITTLFEHATVASLAAHLLAGSDGGVADGGAADAARQRGIKMREARARATLRFGAPA